MELTVTTRLGNMPLLLLEKESDLKTQKSTVVMTVRKANIFLIR